MTLHPTDLLIKVKDYLKNQYNLSLQQIKDYFSHNYTKIMLTVLVFYMLLPTAQSFGQIVAVKIFTFLGYITGFVG